jgi:hypothetical protein
MRFRTASQMLWLEHIANVARVQLSPSSKIAHHKPSIIVFSLSVQRDNLRAYLQHWNRIVVTTRYFCAYRVGTKKASLSVCDNLLLICFHDLLVCHTRAFIAYGELILYACGRLEECSQFGHGRYRHE